MSEPAGHDYPAPVARWLQVLAGRNLDGVETLGTVGTGRVRLGPLPWLPIEHRTVHRLGSDQVRDIRLKVGPVPVLRVLDAYIDGRGITKIGPVASVGPEIDQGAYLAMWAEACTWPSAWAAVPGLRWEAIDRARARLVLPRDDAVDELEVTFDRETSYPYAFDTQRFKAKGQKVHWHAECSNLRDYAGIAAWSHVTATWADDPGPWYEAWFSRVVVNPPVAAAIDRARRAIAKASR